jgi:hypothetical protein
MSQLKTWADYPPEVAANFETMRPWPCETYPTPFAGVHQCSVSMGPEGELIVAGWVRDDQGAVFHSVDEGRTWRLLCEVPYFSQTPAGYTKLTQSLTGSGYAADGSIVVFERFAYNDGRPYEGFSDETLHGKVLVLRSTDRGRTWDVAADLDPAPHQVIGGDEVSARRLSDHRLLLPQTVHDQSRPERPLPLEQYVSRGFLYCSEDHGATWYRLAPMGEHTDESWVAEHPSGRLVASTRYQRKRLPSDPANMATPYYFQPDHDVANCAECRGGPTAMGGHSVYKQSAVIYSDDAGRTWSPPRIVTGWLQQTACLIVLSDGTLVMPFSHKLGTHGQRFIVSYDRGESWSRAIWELGDCGMYASSVVMPDDTIVTVHDGYKGRGTDRRLTALRWRVPPRQEVERYGVFAPNLAG